MAYYISFLKTLSLKLNRHSIHFFFNEVSSLYFITNESIKKPLFISLKRASEFPLYVEAIKFFDHPEAMVRIAVRTLTLNVFNGNFSLIEKNTIKTLNDFFYIQVQVQSMQTFIKEKTASFYFANLIWLIRNQLLDLDLTIKNTVE